MPVVAYVSIPYCGMWNFSSSAAGVSLLTQVSDCSLCKRTFGLIGAGMVVTKPSFSGGQV